MVPKAKNWESLIWKYDSLPHTTLIDGGTNKCFKANE